MATSERPRPSAAVAMFVVTACSGPNDGLDPDAFDPTEKTRAPDAAKPAELDASPESGGTSQTATAPDGCQPPSGATALCLSFNPEAIAPESSPDLDQRGALLVQVFDTPAPPAGEAASAAALYERSVPADPESGNEIALSNLPEPTVVLEDAPPTVYVRALFFDSARALADRGSSLHWGTWVGGTQLVDRGLVEDPSLVPVNLVEGQVTQHEVALTALRRLIVTVTTSVTPLGDGEGALSVVASPAPGLPPNVPTHGYGIDPCVDVTRGPQTVDVAFIGSGTFFVTGFFDDLGIETPGRTPPGTMLTVSEVEAESGDATYDQVSVTKEQYAADVTIDLDYLTEFEADAVTVGPNSCADLGLPGSP